MYGIVLSAINSGLTFIFKTVIVKFLIFFAIYFVVHGFISVLVDYLPSYAGLDNIFLELPAGVWYFLDICEFGTGFSMVISAYVLRFMVRRIPFIG